MTVALVVTTDNEMSLVEYKPPDYNVIKTAVGGYYEHVCPMGLKEPYAMMCNEEGLLLGLPVNRLGSFLYGTHFHGNPIVGNILIVKDGFYNGEPDVIGMSEEEAKSLGDAFVSGTGGIVHWKNPPQTGGQTHG